ncbi:MAG: FAD-dependent oxidoreductase [Chloroflexi bacterium]|nr:FAD-dependent oxidoreductase [Chloroflexota bacterium]
MATSWDFDTDVVVVGGGACGLMAAVHAATHAGGVDVVLLEKNERWGCNAELASGTLQAAGTRLQQAADIDDSPEIMYGDIMRKNHGRSDPAVTMALCRQSAEMVHWFIDHLGLPLVLATEIRRIGHTRMRMHAHPTRSGKPIVRALRERLAALPNVVYADNTPGRGLVTDDQGQVIGVLVGPDGQVQRIRCKRVVLATDGFGASKEMLGRYIPEMRDALYVGAQGNTGEGIRWGMEVGAAVEHIEGYQGLGYVHPTSGTRINPGVVISGGIVVNRLAERFEREDQGYSEWAGVVLGQPGGIGITIWDERIQRLYAHAHTMVESLEAGTIVRADSLEELARHFGLEAAKLAASVEDYNRGVERGCDRLGRELLERPLAPPYYGAMITGGLAHTFGGLKIDVHGRVLRPDGAPVPNLYAGGGTAVGVSGDTPDGYLSASGLLTAYGLGMIIGQHSARTLREAPS